MSGLQFDRWSVALGTTLTRRAVGAGAALVALGGVVGADARKKKKKKKKKGGGGGCVAESTATTCAGKCGNVENNCDDAVACGPCGYTFDTSWGGFGTANGKFESPVGIAVDADGDVYVADTQNDRIQVFSNTGTHKATWVNGTLFEDDSISTPQNITISGNAVYVTSQFLSKVQVFNRNGEFQAILSDGPSDDPGKLDGPRGLDVAPVGNLVIADRDNNRIQVLSNTGAFVDEWGGLPLSDDPGEFNDPSDVAVDGSGNVFVSDYENNRIQKFDGTGVFVKQWGGAASTGEEKLDGPDGIAVDAAGNVYIADAGNRTVKKFTNNGGFIASIGSPEPANGGLGFGLKGVAVDAEGNVFVVHTDTVKKFRPAASANRLGAESRVRRGRSDRRRNRKHG